MKKKILAIILSVPLLLTGCFSSDEESDNGTNNYQAADFSINVPDEWAVIESSDFTSNISAQTAVAFRSNFRSEVFTANLNVLIKDLGEENISASDYAKSSLSKIRSSLLNFQEIASEEVSLGEAETPGYRMSFSGKTGPSQPIIQFEQLYVTDENLGFQITGAHLPDENESVVKQIEEMLDSFSLN